MPANMPQMVFAAEFSPLTSSGLLRQTLWVAFITAQAVDPSHTRQRQKAGCNDRFGIGTHLHRG
jgi:hypothetical protein